MTTIPALLDRLAATSAGGPAIVSGSETLSFGDLARNSRRIAGGLRDLGIAPGDTVALWLPNRPDWIELFCACARIGVRVFAVNTRFRAAELRDILDRARPAAIVHPDDFLAIDFPAILAEAAGGAPAPAIILSQRTAREVPGAATTVATLRRASPLQSGFALDADTAAILFTTSGTTSAPKHVCHTHGSVVRHAAAAAASFDLAAPATALLQALPFCGVFGFCQAMAALAAGRPSHLLETFDAAAAATLIGDAAITHFNATDDMLAALAAAAGDAGAFAGLRLVGAASFNAGPDLLERLALTHGLPVVGLYGMSEVQALFARRSPSDPPTRRYRPGGRPVSADAEVRIRDPETGALLPPGEPGEIEIRGPGAMAGYDGDAAATAAATRDDGFLRTGDLGHLDGDGGFTFAARMGDALRLGGFLVNPTEIAARIEAEPGVAGCQVVGLATAAGVRAIAFVVMAPGAAFDESALRSACRRDLAKFKVPERFFSIPAFPVADGANGIKIQRGRLREMAAEYCGNA